MISIANKTVSYISKIGLTILVGYTILFLAYKTIIYYKIAIEKEQLEIVLQEKRVETNNLKSKVEASKNKIEAVEKQYISKEELETKVKDIFERMSVLDYEIKYLDSKKMCLDRYLIVTQVSAQSEKGLQAAEGILSYIGNIKKSEKNESIYFVDYVSKAREIK
ncbi:MAG: hypothetical protein PHY66_00610 [Aliarcobacter sp.]|nr:hypothetical protein [Aliarcobacter sp.]